MCKSRWTCRNEGLGTSGCCGKGGGGVVIGGGGWTSLDFLRASSISA